MDGTLVDSQHAIMAVMATAFAAEGLPRAGAGRRAPAGGARHRGDHGPAPARGGRGSALRRLSQGFREAAHALRSTAGFAEPLYPGVREALDGLRHPEVFLAIATGKARRGLDFTLSSHGLTALFHSLQTADRNPSKPNPAMLLNAMAEVGVEPSETVFIGDSIFDMTMAANARTAALGVAWGYHDPGDLRAAGAERIIQTPGELGPTLAAMGLR